ncbi:unnamed protein product [Pleuronectes platessa]|uniref:Uncharacterized protein n=1 Tax=Pleuronectes platessa TaxID=8262 RepID=A0A9N7YIG4_PLEPL|nr:unnamed protein product [Pleuronectes platessa]
MLTPASQTVQPSFCTDLFIWKKIRNQNRHQTDPGEDFNPGRRLIGCWGDVYPLGCLVTIRNLKAANSDFQPRC